MKMMGIQKKIAFIKQLVTVEPLVICYVTAKAICDPALKNLELEKACRVNSQFNTTVCSDIMCGTHEQQNFTEENGVVQSYITKMHAWQLTTSNVLAIILILFLGSYSDRHKIRKPFILFTLFGQILALTGCILCVTFMAQWPLEVQGFMQEVVYALFGGEKMLLMVLYAYITDISTVEMRTRRMAIIQAIWNICYTAGQSFSGALLHSIGYMSILPLGLILCVFALLYGAFYVSEPIKLHSDLSIQKRLLDIFNPTHVLETFKTLAKYQGICRISIISILIVQYINSTVSYGELSVTFLFTQNSYEWTVADYSFYTAITTITNSFGLFVIVPLFTKGLKLNDLIIIILSYSSKIATNIIIMTVSTPTGLYIGCVPGVLKTLAIVGIRSQLTKYVSSDDVGKALSLYTVVDSLGEGIASQIYNNGIYEHTRISFPQAFLLLGIALNFLGIVVLVWMYFKKNVETPSCNHVTDFKKTNVGVFSITLSIETTHL